MLTRLRTSSYLSLQSLQSQAGLRRRQKGTWKAVGHLPIYLLRVLCLLTKCCWFCKYVSSVLNGLTICGLFASAELFILQKIKYTPRCLQNQSLILQSQFSFVKQHVKTLFFPWPKKYVWGMCVWATATVFVHVIASLQLSMHFFIIPSDSVGRQPCSLCLVCLMPYFKLTC